jgi:membrane fusion protein (multidrug efflux system)
MVETTLEPPQDVVKTDGQKRRATDRPTTVTPQVPNKKRRMIVIGGAAGLAVVAVLVPWIYSAFTHESTDDAFIDAHVSNIAARVEGQVTKVYIDDNQVVKQGDPLIEIDPADYEVRLDQARAQLLSAEALAGRTARDLRRYQKLVRTDEVTQQQLDTAKSDADAAQANLLLQQAGVKHAELDLSYTHVVAPESGRVTHKSVETGDYLKVGTPILATVPTHAWVTANFKETQLTHMKPGQSVKIEVDAYPGREFTGHVDSIQSGTGAQFSLLPPENATGNYVKVVQRIPVKILIDTIDDAHPLVPGMSVVPTVKVN